MLGAITEKTVVRWWERCSGKAKREAAPCQEGQWVWVCVWGTGRRCLGIDR
jgi:hypothetical protein